MVKNNKDDLTRIEDVGTFEHDELEPGPPDLPDHQEGPSPDIENPPQEFPMDQEESLNSQEEDSLSGDTFSEIDPSGDDPFSDNSSSISPTQNEENLQVEEENLEESSLEFEQAPIEEIESTISQNRPIEEELIVEEHQEMPLEEFPPNPIMARAPIGPKDFQEVAETPLSNSPSLTSEEEIPLQKKENLQDLKNFAGQILPYDNTLSGSPPFSLLLKKVISEKDREEILEILDEYKIIPEDQVDSAKRTLARGQLLISQISEYVGIFLAHRFRKYNLELSLGPSSLIHPPKNYEETPEEKSGPQSQSTLNTNYLEEKNLSSTGMDLFPITTLSFIKGKEIQEEKGPLFLRIELGPDEWSHFEENGGDVSLFLPQIKERAHKMGANAILGIQMQISGDQRSPKKFPIIISGQAVWVE